jgi:serine/threonine-protein kinase
LCEEFADFEMNPAVLDKQPEQRIGRYAIFDQIAVGGMATVHLARLTSVEGFSRVVAIKRMHRHLLENAELKQMFLAEARLAARVRHPNVVPILDVLSHEGELLIVLEYVHGESLHALMRAATARGATMPRAIACTIAVAALQGLHAAHEAKDEHGRPLELVHRDVSPQNILVGDDGVTRVLDFGVAKAIQAKVQTDPGVLKGKFSYIAPEVIQGAKATRRADVFSTATVIWELLTGKKLFAGTTEQERLVKIVKGGYPRPSDIGVEVPAELEAVVMKGLAPDPAERYGAALDMAIELERHAELASQRVVGEWVARYARGTLEHRADLIQAIETSSVGRTSFSPPSLVPLPAAGSAPPSPSLRAAPHRSGIQERGHASRGRALLWVAAGAGITLVVAIALTLLASRSREGAASPSSSSELRATAAPAIRAAPSEHEPVASPPSSQASAAGAPLPPPALTDAPPAGAEPAPRATSVRKVHPVKPKSKPKEFLPDDL